MAPILKTYKATVNGIPYYFLQRTGAYQGSLDTISGVAEAGEEEQDQPVYAVAELLNKTILMRLYISYKVGEIRKRAQLLVARDKVGTALDALVNETYRGGTITKAGMKRDASFRA
jgi:hypothetical protein